MGLRGHPSKSLEDRRAESDVDFGGLAQGVGVGSWRGTIVTTRLKTIIVIFWQRKWLLRRFQGSLILTVSHSYY